MRTLSHSAADIIAQLLVDLGLGVAYSSTANWSVSVATEQDYPDNTLTVYDTTGIDHGSVMTGGPDDGELQGHYGVQIRIRAVSHVVGWPKADTIRATLAQSVNNRIVHVDSSTYRVENMANIGNVIVLGKNIADSKTNLFTINAAASIVQTA